jgi:hypothetical protein
MADAVRIGFPADDCDCVIALGPGSPSTRELALGLYGVYQRYSREGGLGREVPFADNEVYQLLHVKDHLAVGDGLVFRYYAGDPPVIEFYIPPEFEAARRKLMLDIPLLVEMAGVVDPFVLHPVRDAVLARLASPDGSAPLRGLPSSRKERYTAAEAISLFHQLADLDDYRANVIRHEVIPLVRQLPADAVVTGAFFADKPSTELAHLIGMDNLLGVLVSANEAVISSLTSNWQPECLLAARIRDLLGYTITGFQPL